MADPSQPPSRRQTPSPIRTEVARWDPRGDGSEITLRGRTVGHRHQRYRSVRGEDRLQNHLGATQRAAIVDAAGAVCARCAVTDGCPQLAQVSGYTGLAAARAWRDGHPLGRGAARRPRRRR